MLYTPTHTHTRERERSSVAYPNPFTFHLCIFVADLFKKETCMLGRTETSFFSEKMAALRDIGRGRESVKERMSYS